MKKPKTRPGPPVPAPLTNVEIAATFRLQACTINALLGILAEKGLLTNADIAAMNARRDRLLASIQAADSAGSRIIRPA